MSYDLCPSCSGGAPPPLNTDTITYYQPVLSSRTPPPWPLTPLPPPHLHRPGGLAGEAVIADLSAKLLQAGKAGQAGEAVIADLSAKLKEAANNAQELQAQVK